MKEKIIDIDTHAFFRMLERGTGYGLDFHETKERAFQTVRLGSQAIKKHQSKQGPTYYHYFHDNLSFYVICKEKEFPTYIKTLIKTVIIEKGRQ